VVAEDGRILDFPAYESGVVENLRRMGFCAFWDGAELALKRTNDHSEQYDIVRADGYSIVLYAATCRHQCVCAVLAGLPRAQGFGWGDWC
jgi:hypothetical protein